MRTSAPGRGPTAVLVGVLVVLSASPGTAQEDVVRLATACAASEPTLESACLETVLAAQAAQGLVGLAVAGATALPGSSSTLGKRFDGRPRLGFSVRGGFVRGPFPGEIGPPAGVASDESAFVPSVQATAAAGLFQGFSTAPTVGGILALDLVGTFSYVDLPGDRGLEDAPAALGAGIRVGILRESFTLPGITVSATRRWLGDVRLTDGVEGGTAVTLDGTATALRATVGKTLAGSDVLIGLGWDRYAADVDLVVLPPGPGGPTSPRASTGADDFESDRLLVYGGLGYTFLVYQLSLEGGWARGFDDVPDRAGGGYDPTDGTPFLRLGFRLTF